MKTRAKRILKCDWVTQQTFEACRTGKVTVRTGHTIPVWLAFRCLFCGEYFSQSGAEEHFGTSRADYKGEKDDIIKEEEIITVHSKAKSEIR